MIVKKYASFIEAVEASAVLNFEYQAAKHVLQPRKGFKKHYHPLANEFIVVYKGRFSVTIGEERRIIDCNHKCIVVYFPAGQIHRLVALTETRYQVYKDKQDATLYCSEE